MPNCEVEHTFPYYQIEFDLVDFQISSKLYEKSELTIVLQFCRNCTLLIYGYVHIRPTYTYSELLMLKKLTIVKFLETTQFAISRAQLIETTNSSTHFIVKKRQSNYTRKSCELHCDSRNFQST